MVFSTLSSIQCDFDILKSVSAIAFAQGVQEFVFILRPVSHEASHAMPLPPDVDALSDDEGPQPGIHRPLPADIDKLSDDDALQGPVDSPNAHALAVPPDLAGCRRKQKREKERIADVAHHRKRLRAVVSARCKCKNPDCRTVFQNDAIEFEAVLRKRLLIADLPKQEADKEDSWFQSRNFLFIISSKRVRRKSLFYSTVFSIRFASQKKSFSVSISLKVFDLLSVQNENARASFKLLGHRVCFRAFHLILGIGKFRAGRIRRAALRGEECPVDGRFLPKRHAYMSPSSVRPQVLQFLGQVYPTVAEPLPETRAKDDGIRDQIELTTGPVKKRGKRPRHMFKLDDVDRYIAGVKFLPPGSILDYWDLCKHEYPDLKIGRKVFCRVPWLVIIISFWRPG